MSTTLSAIEQKQFNLFLQLTKPATFTCFSDDGALYITDGDHTLMIGEHEGADVSFRCPDGKALAKYVRAAKVKSVIETSVRDETKLDLDCDALGPMTFAGKPWSYDQSPLDELGSYMGELDVETVAKVAPFASRCDDDNDRLALMAVVFDKDHAVACDGRRLVTYEIPSISDETTFMVPDGVVKMAAKLGEEILFNKNRCVVGQSIHRYVDGRFPNWRQVIPEVDTSIEVDCDALRQQCKQAKNKAKINDTPRDEYEVEIDLIDGVCVWLDFEFVLDALGKLNSATLAWDNSDDATDDDGRLKRPVLLTSDEMPEWREVIMPKAIA